jgi:hypothetical protein
MRKRYQLSRFQKRSPEKFNSLVNQLFDILDKIDREISRIIG